MAAKKPQADSVKPKRAPRKKVADDAMMTDPVTSELVAEENASAQDQIKHPGPLRRFLRILGPGLITGAADDDPSGVATYTQTGAQFGYGQLWMIPFMYPLMTAVQEACARIGAVTGKGLAAVIRDRYSRAVLYLVVGLVVLANTINIGADIGAMASAMQLIVPLPFTLLTLMFTILILVLEIAVPYRNYVKILKWLALALLAYPLTALITPIDWGLTFRELISPNITFSFEFIFLLVALLGTTITPYMFFWQASEEVEEEIANKRLAQRGGTPRISHRYIRNLRIDNAFGMAFSEIAAFFIMLTGAAVLHANGVTSVDTAADAAKALQPLVEGFPHAGFLASLIFTIGIVGLGMLAVPVLAGSASYALAEAFGWHEGLYRKFRQAHGFYGVMTISTLAGLMINFVGIDPVKALIYSSVFNGLAAIPLIYLILRLSTSEELMGEYKGRWLSRIVLTATFLIMLSAGIAMIVALLQ